MVAPNRGVVQPGLRYGPKEKRRGLLLLSDRQQEVVWAYVLLAPTIIGLVLFTLGPFLASLALAFVSTNFINEFRWVGLGNFAELFGDSLFWVSLGNTATYVVGHVIPTVALGLGLAMALNQQRVRGLSLFRTIFFLPVVTPIVCSALVWAWAYDSEVGVFNFFLRSLGLSPIPWLTSSHWSMPSVIVWSIWSALGYPIILFLAALQGVPQELIEAAKLDGAGAWQTFRHITFPAVSPATFLIVVLLIIGSAQVFTQVYVMTNGGPGYSTYTMVFMLYIFGWNDFRFGYASAVAVVLFVILAALTFLQFRVQSRWVHYEYD